MKAAAALGAVSFTLLLGTAQDIAPREMEALGRGVVAVRQNEREAFVSWRLLGTEPPDTAFNVYRVVEAGKPVRLNTKPLSGPTHFIDHESDASRGVAYFVRAIVRGREQPSSGRFTLPAAAARPYLIVPLKTPPDYTPNDGSVGDLDGDGEYEIVLHQTLRGRDNSQGGVTGEPILQVTRLDGTLLRQVNLGRNIREGAHYTQFMVYDLDGDGRAEVACKTADGTIDGRGKIIGDANADHRNDAGFVLRGPEFLTIFDGLTGAALATTAYIPPRGGDGSGWGDSRGNRVDRFLAAVAYLDGRRPSLVMARGYYTRAVLAAWNWRDEKMTTSGRSTLTMARLAMRHTGDRESSAWGCRRGRARRNHLRRGRNRRQRKRTPHDRARRRAASLGSTRIALARGLQHPGAIRRCRANFRDARTGESVEKAVDQGGRRWRRTAALSLNIDPRHRGHESWVAGAGITGLFSAKGRDLNKNEIATSASGGTATGCASSSAETCEVELNRRHRTTLLTDQVTSNNSTGGACSSATSSATGAVIWRTTDNQSLRIYTTTMPTKHRLMLLMHDPQYRLSIAWQNRMQQPPHTSFYVGRQKPAPRPPLS
jgi:rhamnogalacturonan endolyase